MTTPTVVHRALADQIEAGLMHAASHTANSFMSDFVSNRKTELTLEDAKLLAQALGFDEIHEMFATLNGKWAERSFGVHLTVEWVRNYTADGWKTAAIIGYRDV